MSTERAIFWYTFESPVFRLVNSMIRLSRHPAEIFYIQPYVRDLH